MEDKRAEIRDLEEKNRLDLQVMNNLYENLGESLFQRMGEGEPFPESGNESTGKDNPGLLLAEYQKLHSDILESKDIIKSLEADIQRLKELDSEISEKEKEQSSLESEFDEINVKLGEALMEAADSDDPLKPQEIAILEKIKEQEEKLSELEGKEGGIFAWIGKNAQMAVSKGLLLKNNFALQRLYRSAGEKFVSSEEEHFLTGEAGETAEKARELKETLSSLAVNLAMLKGERRNMGDLFSSDGSPSRRIQSQEKLIAGFQSQFPVLHRRFGILASDVKSLSSHLNKEDKDIIKKTSDLKTQIAKRDLEINLINTAIKIDDEKNEIDRFKKSIQGQRQKISAAEEAIGSLEKQIKDAEKRIEQLTLFIEQNGGK